VTQAFSYHRAVAPMMWAFVGIALVELVVTHLLVALWKPWVAVLLTLISASGVIWLVGVIRSFKRLLIEGDRLILRVGTLKRVDLAREQVGGLREQWSAETFKQGGALKLSLLAYPNVMVELTEPIAGWRGQVHTIGHRLDDPTGFGVALGRWRARESQ
jgi:hypothetical protein